MRSSHVSRHPNEAARRLRQGERGAVLIHVAVALVGLLAFAVLTIDYGVMWVSRRQAQNSADAGALSGAISLAYVAPSDFNLARAGAESAGEANLIFGVPPDIQPGEGNSGDVSQDISFPPCPPGAPGLPDTCVRVNVYRNQDRGPALPVFFGPLVGVTEQGVRATATAQIISSSATRCIRPWWVPEKWVDHWDNNPDPPECTERPNYGSWDESKQTCTGGDCWCYEDQFDVAGQKSGNDPVPTKSDDAASPLAQWKPTDNGTMLQLKQGSPQATLVAGWFWPVDLPRPGGPDTGGDRYRENIATCNKYEVVSGPTEELPDGSTLWTENGNMVGPTKQGVADLIANAQVEDGGVAVWDPDVVINPSTDPVYGTGCPVMNGECFNSYRNVPLPTFDLTEFFDPNLPKNTGKFSMHVNRLLCFFVDHVEKDSTVVGYLYSNCVGEAGSGPMNDPSSFLRSVILVR